MINSGSGRQHGQRLKNLRSMLHVAAGDFPNDEWVTYDQVVVQQASKSR